MVKLSKREARAVRSERAIVFACACVNKEPHDLTEDDLVQAQMQALRERNGGIHRTLTMLIQFPEVRELYCRGPHP